MFQQSLDAYSGNSNGGSNAAYSSPITSATSCIATPSLPSGLNIDSSTCTISGTPAADSSNTTYTITAVINGNTYQASIWLSTFTFGEITSTVEGATLQLGEAMAPITLNYTSQDGHQTAPVNVTGNGSVWWDNQDIFCDCGEHMAIVHGNTIYMDGVASGSAGHELYAYSIDTGMSWLVADINSNGDSVPGERMSVLIGDTIIFDADDGVHDRELWAHNVLTNTTWLVKDINPNANQLSFIGGNFAEVMNGVLYFDAYEPANNVEIWGFDPQNGTSWNVTDSFTSMNQEQPGQKMIQVVGDTIYFSGREDTGWPYPAGTELWAYTATNQTTWLAADINPGSSASDPGEDFSVVIGDTIYFDGKITTGANLADRKIIAYDTSNHTHWVVTDVDQSDTLSYRDYNQMEYIGVVGSTIYTIGTNYIGMGPTGLNFQSRQIWAINIENETAWQVPNFPCLYSSGCIFPVNNMRLIVNDVIYFGFDDDSNAEELWAYNTTNETAWMITDLPGNPFTGFSPGEYMSLLVGDTIYFSGEAHDNSFQQGGYPGLGIASAGHLWAYDTSNESLYFFSNHYTDMPTHPTDIGTWNCNLIISHGVSPGMRFSFVIDDVLYYDIGADWSQSTSYNGNCPMPRVAGYQPSVITYSNYTPPVSWETEPPLPAGMSISGGTISGTPSVYASNQTYTIYANQSGYSTTHELYFSVDNAYPHTVVEDQPIDAIGFHPAFFDGTTTWSISPSLPNSLVQDTATGEITGTVDDAISSTYTVTATHSSGASETFTFSIDSLLDTDGDGLPNELPPTYNPANPPTSGLIADDDDDGDGLLDVVETGTGIYVDGQDTGTDPLDPDTDGDGICDGPNAVSGVCIAGPDADPNGLLPPATLVALNNTDIGTLSPYLSVDGGTFEISPELPNSLSMDPNTGVITGIPIETMANTTFTVWSNHSDGTSLTYDFTIEILEDSDGDGLPNKLPDDYDSSNPTSPGLIEDLDDDADGIPDTNETDTGSYVDESDTGTSPTNPDSDADGMCDGPNAVSNVCTAGPDAFPLDPAGDTDTDGDGKPDVLKPGVDSTSVPPLEEDLDDDGDGWEDVNETGTNVYVDETDTGTDSKNPDTDGDGICDGPLAVPGICGAGPDERPFGEPFEGQVYGVNNSFFPSLMPEVTLQPGSTWEVHPDLPEGLEIDPDTGRITGVPTESMANTTFTVYGNGSDGVNVEYQFSMEILDDYDGDGVPNDLPDDYPVNGTLIEDNDDDNDGIPDEYETGTGVYVNGTDLGTDALNPDTDGDGMCDGPVAIENVCDIGPDAFPLDPAGDTDTDGDGKPDVLKPGVDSTSTPALEEDLDDDGDNVPDTDEDAAGTDSLLPDTDGDGVCDGDIAVGSVCVAGPDAFPLDPSASVDTDDDGHPDEWNDGKRWKRFDIDASASVR